jgi:DNA-binding transcriptional LysR family regulator
MPLNALRAFEAVGRNLSFTAGAAALSVSQSAMSRHVAGLEDLLGKRLFDRDGAKLALTPEGEILLAVVGQAFERIEGTLNQIRDETVTGRGIRVHVPPSLLQQVFLPVLAEFHAANPEITIDVTSTHVTGFPNEDVEMAIVYDLPHVDDRITDLLWMVRVAPLCSPETARLAEGLSMEAFLASQELLHVKLDDQPRDFLWATYFQKAGIIGRTSGGIAFDTSIAAVKYAMTSGGVALGDVDMFAQEIADGALVMPYDAILEDGFSYYLKLHPDDLADPAVSVFRSWLINRFGAMGQPSGRPRP